MIVENAPLKHLPEVISDIPRKAITVEKPKKLSKKRPKATENELEKKMKRAPLSDRTNNKRVIRMPRKLTDGFLL